MKTGKTQGGRKRKEVTEKRKEREKERKGGRKRRQGEKNKNRMVWTEEQISNKMPSIGKKQEEV